MYKKRGKQRNECFRLGVRTGRESHHNGSRISQDLRNMFLHYQFPQDPKELCNKVNLLLSVFSFSIQVVQKLVYNISMLFLLKIFKIKKLKETYGSKPLYTMSPPSSCTAGRIRVSNSSLIIATVSESSCIETRIHASQFCPNQTSHILHDQDGDKSHTPGHSDHCT